MIERALPSRVVVAGSADGHAVVLDEPLSLWGGLDADTGCITDVRHPQHGVCVSGQVLVLPYGRGSSSASSVLVEAARLGTGPVGLVLRQPDEILTLGALVAFELYGLAVPVVVLDPADYERISTGDRLLISSDSVRLRGE